MINQKEPRGKAHPTDLLLSYLEDDLSPGERDSVSVHLSGCAHCRREIKKLKDMVATLKEYGGELCPEPDELYEFANFNVDHESRIASHLTSCALCRAEVARLKPLEQSHTMPEETWRKAEQIKESHKIISRPEKWFKRLVSVSTLTAASLAAALCIIFLYPNWISENLKRVEPGQQVSKTTEPDVPPSQPRLVIAMSSNTWESKAVDSRLMSPRTDKTDETGGPRSVFFKSVSPETREEAGSINKVDAKLSSKERPRLAKVILLDGLSGPPPNLELRFLYDCIKPDQRQRDLFEFVTPRQMEEAKDKGLISTTSVDRFVEGLRDHLKVPQAVLITLNSRGENFDITARLVDLSTGKVMEERTGTGVSASQLPLQLRMLSSMPD